MKKFTIAISIIPFIFSVNWLCMVIASAWFEKVFPRYVEDFASTSALIGGVILGLAWLALKLHMADYPSGKK